MNNNDIKIKKLKQRKILQVLIIVFGVITLLAAVYSLVFRNSFIPTAIALVAFLIEAILTKIRNSIKLKEEDLDSKN